MDKYHNRLGYDLSVGDVVILTDHFDVQGQEWNAGEQLTVKVIHSDWGHLWGVETVDGLTALSGYYLGYGEAMLIEYVRPLRADEEREPTVMDAEKVRELLRATLGGAEVTPTAPPSAEASGMTWEDYQSAMGDALKAKTGHCHEFRDGDKVIFRRGMEGIAEGGERGFIWFDKADSQWLLELDAGGSVFIREVPEVLEVLLPAELVGKAKFGGTGKLVTDMYKDCGVSEPPTFSSIWEEEQWRMG